MIRRRGFIAGFASLLAAPAIIRSPGLLMPIKPLVLPAELPFQTFDWDAVADGSLVLPPTPGQLSTAYRKALRASYLAHPVLREMLERSYGPSYAAGASLTTLTTDEAVARALRA